MKSNSYRLIRHESKETYMVEQCFVVRFEKRAREFLVMARLRMKNPKP